MVEDHESAHRTAFLAGFEERINHRKSVDENIGERHSDQVATLAGDAAVGSAPAIFDNACFNVAVLDHHRVVEHRHVGHAAVAMARVEIGTEYGVLL